jgi:transposase InsO family protein
MTMACQCPSTHRTRRCVSWGTILGPAATTARGLRSTASTLLKEEGAFHGNIVEAKLRTTRRKNRRRHGEVVRRQLGKSDKIHDIYSRAAYWAERVRLM